MRLELKNIGQFETLSFNKDSKIQIIGGVNGSGKTSFLEFLNKSLELSNDTFNKLASYFLEEKISELSRSILFVNDKDLLKFPKFLENTENARTVKQVMELYNTSVGEINRKIREYIDDSFYIFSDEYFDEKEMFTKFRLKKYKKEDIFLNDLKGIFNTNIRKFILDEILKNKNEDEHMSFNFSVEEFSLEVFSKEDDSSRTIYNVDIPEKKHNNVMYFKTSSAHTYYESRAYRYRSIHNKAFNYSNDIKKILEKISSEIPIVTSNKKRNQYEIKIGSSNKLINRIATGMNVFMFLYDIITSGKLNSNTVIILDEPDAHLHSKWILLLAETLSDIVKVFDVKIILATHNDFFIEALTYNYLKNNDEAEDTKSISFLHLMSENFMVNGEETVISNSSDIIPLLQELAAPKLGLLYDKMSE